MGKGSKPRPTNLRKYEQNFEQIQWKSKKVSNKGGICQKKKNNITK